MNLAPQDFEELGQQIKSAGEFIDRIRNEISKAVVGQSYMIERLLLGILAGGHVLLEGVPGLAKTLTVKSLSDTLQADFQRIQFTPDLLPADLIGTMIFNPATREFEPRKGPVFANMLLADEINRAPAKVQSALLEAMQEKQVTLGDTTFQLPRPFLVLATQNPIEQEGTYPLPEAQVDRFMLMLRVGYPTKEEERLIMDRISDSIEPVKLQPVASTEDILRARKWVRNIYIDDKLRDYIVNIIVATRNPTEYGLKDITPYLEYGASPRASINLNLAARAHAFLRHRTHVFPEDIKAVAIDVLRHRVSLTYLAESEEITPENIIEEVLKSIEVP